MEDKLKKFVNENRKAFDRRAPSPAVWNRIKEGIQKPATPTPDPIRRLRPHGIGHVAAASAAALLLFGTIWLWRSESDSVPKNNMAATKKEKSFSRPPSTTGSQDILGSDGKRDSGGLQENQTEALARDHHDHHIASSQNPVSERLAKRSMPDEGYSSVEKIGELHTKNSALALLHDEESAINRMEGILQLAASDHLDKQAMESISYAMTHDNNSNVRLAAYDTFIERSSPELREQTIQEVFLAEDDPTLQMELMHAMAYTDSIQIQPGTIEKLATLTQDPFTMDVVKEQAYAVLMKTW